MMMKNTRKVKKRYGTIVGVGSGRIKHFFKPQSKVLIIGDEPNVYGAYLCEVLSDDDIIVKQQYVHQEDVMFDD